MILSIRTSKQNRQFLERPKSFEQSFSVFTIRRPLFGVSLDLWKPPFPGLLLRSLKELFQMPSDLLYLSILGVVHTILYYTILYYTLLYYTIPCYTMLYHVMAVLFPKAASSTQPGRSSGRCGMLTRSWELATTCQSHFVGTR